MIIKFESFVRRGGWWVVAQFALFGLILIALTGNTTPSGWLRTAGWILVALAVVLAGGGFWLIRNKLTALPAPLEGAVLLDRGPFALVRHPIYGGLILGFLGLAVKGGNVAAALASLALIPFFWAKTNQEESLLIVQIPEYAGYREQVPHRFLPWIV